MRTTPQIRHLASRAERTRYVEMSGGGYDFALWVAPDADLEGAFLATCAETGDCLFLKGWLLTVEG